MNPIGYSQDVMRIPLAESSFESLRDADLIYVDKTDLIASLASFREPVFLSRPRRFGKSLLVSTLESLFAHGLSYFQDLKLVPLWHETATYWKFRQFTLSKPSNLDIQALMTLTDWHF